MDQVSVHQLLESYERLRALYERLAVITGEVFSLIQAGSGTAELSPKLKENAEVAESISKESHEIAAMKQAIADGSAISAIERGMLKNSEQSLSDVVGRVMDMENKSRELIMKQGMKINRR